MEWLNISTSVELVRVQTDDIVFVQADGNYSDMYLFNGKFHKMTFKLKFFEDAFLSLPKQFLCESGQKPHRKQEIRLCHKPLGSGTHYVGRTAHGRL